MADIADVEAAFAEAVAGILYPRGADGAHAVAPARIYRGWPQEAALDADLAAGIVTVTVNQRAGYLRNTTRYQHSEQIAAAPPPGLTASVTGDVAAFGGAAAAGQVVGIVGAGVRHAERTRADDTVESLLSRIAAALPGALLDGSTLTLPGLREVRIQADARAARETRRQEAQIAVTVWAPSREMRDAVASLVDAEMSDVRALALADGTAAEQIRLAGDRSDDGAQEASLYRRELVYQTEYPTVRTRDAVRVIFSKTSLRAQGAAVLEAED